MINFTSVIIVKLIIAFFSLVLSIVGGYDYVRWEKLHNKNFPAIEKTTSITNKPGIYIIHHSKTLKSNKL